MKKLFKEFAAFINKGNALALAIGVIIGGAFTGIVTAINQKIISPIIGWILGGESLAENPSLTTILVQHTELNELGEEIVVVDNAIYWGALIQAVIDFILIAIVLFLIFKVIGYVRNASVRAHNRLVKKLKKQGQPVVEEVVAEEPVVVEEPKPSDEVLLLTEIRDLLSKNKDKE